MSVDKKNIGGSKRIVILKSIGDAGSGAHGVDDKTIRLVLSPSVQVVPSGSVKRSGHCSSHSCRPISGSIRVPGSKSISNRVLLMAALGTGNCILRGLLYSDDTKVW